MSTPNGKIFLLSLLLSNNRGKLAYLIGIRQEQKIVFLEVSPRL